MKYLLGELREVEGFIRHLDADYDRVSVLYCSAVRLLENSEQLLKTGEYCREDVDNILAIISKSSRELESLAKLRARYENKRRQLMYRIEHSYDDYRPMSLDDIKDEIFKYGRIGGTSMF